MLEKLSLTKFRKNYKLVSPPIVTEVWSIAHISL